MKNLLKNTGFIFLLSVILAFSGCSSKENSSPLADADAVTADVLALEINIGTSTDVSNIISNLQLPAVGANGTTIAWVSTNENVIAVDGTVTRPAFGLGDSDVTLTATITRGDVTETKTFNLKVKETPPTDVQAVGEDKEALAVTFGSGDDAGGVTQNFTVSLSGPCGSEITWGETSDPDSAVSISNGIVTVTRPAFGQDNAVVTLTATIKKGDSTETKSFVFTVEATPPTDAEAVIEDTDGLAIIFDSGDTITSVTKDFTLQLSGPCGTEITWAETTDSGNNVSISNGTVTVTRPDYYSTDAAVTITATITLGSESDTKDFVITIKKNPPTDAQAVAEDKSALSITFGSGDSISSVTQNFTLLLSGACGSTITWAETTDTGSNVSISGSNVTVTRPAYANGDATVTITATITMPGANSTKDFVLTVKAQLPVISKYVKQAADGGSNSNNGNTPATAYETITYALSQISSGSIAVAAGTYDETVALKSGVNLYGGYNTSFTDRDRETRTNYQTIIRRSTQYGACMTGTGSAITTSNTCVEGFIIDKDSALEGYAINITSSANPKIQYCTISSGLSTAVQLGLGGGGLIQYCDISNKITLENYYYTISLTGGGTATIKYCTIKGATDSSSTNPSVCVYAYYSNPTLYLENNEIYVGKTSSSTNYGISISDANSYIKNNTFHLGYGTGNNTAMYFTGSSGTKIADGNTIVTDEGQGNYLNLIGIESSYSGTTMKNNYIQLKTGANKAAAGIRATGNYGQYCYNNAVFIDANSTNQTVVGMYIDSSCYIYNNTVYLFNSSFYLYGIQIGPGTNSWVTDFKNNIIQVVSASTNAYGFYASSMNAPVNNCIYLIGSSASSSNNKPTGNLYDVDPKLDTNNRLKLTSGETPSTVYSGGENLYNISWPTDAASHIRTDLNGAARPSTGSWAIGAYVAP